MADRQVGDANSHRPSLVKALFQEITGTSSNKMTGKRRRFRAHGEQSRPGLARDGINII